MSEMKVVDKVKCVLILQTVVVIFENEGDMVIMPSQNEQFRVSKYDYQYPDFRDKLSFKFSLTEQDWQKIDLCLS